MSRRAVTFVYVHVAFFRGRGPRADFDFNQAASAQIVAAAFRRQFAAVRADRHRLKAVVGLIKLLIRQILVDPLHDFFPHGNGGVAGILNRGVALVADPDRRDVIRRVADEITGVIVAGGAGFSGDVHSVEFRRRARARFHDRALQNAGHQIGGSFLHSQFAAERLFYDRPPL